MQLRRQLITLAPVVFVLGATIFGAWLWLRHQEGAALPALIQHLPGQNAALGFASIEALRQNGMLKPDAAPSAREPEYEAFIRKSGFNWEQDLDSIVWSFTADARFFFVTGRFDWTRLQEFVKEEGGECRDEFCTIGGSQPDRQISFFPWRSNVMALAVSEDRYAADRLRLDYRHGITPPQAPFWLHLTGTALKDADPLAPGLKGFLRLLERTQHATIYLVPKDDTFSLELRAQCADSDVASALGADFAKLTEWLNQLLKIEKQEPDDAEFASVLATGKFTASGTMVVGSWPVSRNFLLSLISNE
ncbi:MAG: hypothetical protein KIT83_04340 [Bryobacterales bacterium]|nr:hypothetical protein [Bryobacterales bacterium]